MSELFKPIKLRGLSLDNRIVLSPMCQSGATDGFSSDWHIAHLGTYALANLGLAITEATAVEPKGRISPFCLGLSSDAHQEGLARILGISIATMAPPSSASSWRTPGARRRSIHLSWSANLFRSRKAVGFRLRRLFTMTISTHPPRS